MQAVSATRRVVQWSRGHKQNPTLTQCFVA
ncbi:hypothetical protein XAP6164_1590029 [Xanthomonas phaseoli pv. phaseoli]|nr:hypothetical protein XAP6164_1590029 [Xanthomonas phaseoli pv. phaseoli]